MLRRVIPPLMDYLLLQSKVMKDVAYITTVLYPSQMAFSFIEVVFSDKVIQNQTLATKASISKVELHGSFISFGILWHQAKTYPMPNVPWTVWERSAAEYRGRIVCSYKRLYTPPSPSSPPPLYTLSSLPPHSSPTPLQVLCPAVLQLPLLSPRTWVA